MLLFFIIKEMVRRAIEKRDSKIECPLSKKKAKDKRFRKRRAISIEGAIEKRFKGRKISIYK